MYFDKPDHHRNTSTRHTVVLIEYFNGIPHSVETTFNKNNTYTWDINPFGGDVEYLMIYNSGGGFDLKVDIHAATSDSKCEIWINPEYRKLVIVKQLINAKLIDQPYEHTNGLARSTNPFEYCLEVGDITYCSACGLYFDEDYCPKHDCEFTEGAEEEWASRNGEYQDSGNS